MCAFHHCIVFFIIIIPNEAEAELFSCKPLCQQHVLSKQCYVFSELQCLSYYKTNTVDEFIL